MSLFLWVLTTTGWAKPETTIRMRDRAPVGEPIRLTIGVHNPDEFAVTVPDLTNRPWLVIFDTTDPSGVRRKLFSTPPISDPGQKWTIGPGERREAHFQVPSSGSWVVGDASIQVTVGEEHSSTHTVHLFERTPTRRDDSAHPVDQSGGDRLWVVEHDGKQDVYLQQDQRNLFLASVPETPNIQLSIARAERRTGRWITWTDTQQKLWAMRTDAHGPHEPPFALSLPWPGARACGRPTTDSAGRLVQPICVPAPQGDDVRLMAAVLSAPGTPQFRDMASFEPQALLSNVNAGGDIDFISIRPRAIDRFSLVATDDSTRPLINTQLWRGKAHQRIVHAELIMTTNGTPEPAVVITLDREDTALIIPVDGHTP
jgi:hypothetical protein